MVTFIFIIVRDKYEVINLFKYEINIKHFRWNIHFCKLFTFYKPQKKRIITNKKPFLQSDVIYNDHVI